MEWIGRPAARLFSSEWGVVGRRLVHVLRRVLHFEGGYLQGRVCCNPHTPPPASHLYFHAKDVGVGFVGTYEGDQAELTATVLLGKRSLTLHATLRKLADI